MATTHTRTRTGNETPVEIKWTFTSDGGEKPVINIQNETLLQKVFDRFGVDSVDALVDEFVTGPRNVNELRVGIIAGEGEDAEFYSEEDLLKMVDGINADLAEGLANEFKDIPAMCRRIRRDGDVFLGDLRHDVGVEGKDWEEELNSFIEDLNSESDSFEQRLKDANVWVEPSDVSAF